MAHFTPWHSLAGGALIGLSAALLWLGGGRVAGVSGIAASAILGPRGERGWRIAFLTGLVAAPLAWQMLAGPVAIRLAGGPALLAAAGLLVGFGARLGGGCTSGHGVCGIARLAPRSLTATGLFMAAAAAVVFVARHVLG